MASRHGLQVSLGAYTTAYWWSAVLFVVGLVVSVLLYRRGMPGPPDGPRHPREIRRTSLNGSPTVLAFQGELS
ncbi:hypothetical protein ACFUIY_09240 [Streptomyces griseorubiginosus]|uniref:hypothetical protein n=1 Tax=Streptomyces griseorubiginosus TaxID=67304 RepID=UPI0036348461